MFDITLTKQLASLGKISFTDSELEKINNDMTDIIALMDKVREFDKPSAAYRAEPLRYDALRTDLPDDTKNTPELLANSRNVKEHSFVVPKIV